MFIIICELRLPTLKYLARASPPQNPGYNKIDRRQNKLTIKYTYEKI